MSGYVGYWKSLWKDQGSSWDYESFKLTGPYPHFVNGSLCRRFRRSVCGHGELHENDEQLSVDVESAG